MVNWRKKRGGAFRRLPGGGNKKTEKKLPENRQQQ